MRDKEDECKEETFESLNLDTSHIEQSIDLKMQKWQRQYSTTKDEAAKLKSQLKVLKSKIAIIRILLPQEQMDVSERMKEFEERETQRIENLFLDCVACEPSVFEQIYWYSKNMEVGEIVYCGKFEFQHSVRVGPLHLSIAKVCFPEFVITENVVAHVPHGTQIGPFSNEIFVFCKI